MAQKPPDMPKKPEVLDRGPFAAEAPQRDPLAAEVPPRGPAEKLQDTAEQLDVPQRGPRAEAASPGASTAEVHQHKPFTSLEQEAFLKILRTADHLDQGLAELLKPFALTATQYNVLRILRGAGGRGLACRELGERMLTHDPDVTRLLDRLERRGLLERHREQQDRRVILTGITSAGLRLLEQLDAPVTELHRRQLGHLGEEQLRALVALLEGARG